MYENKNNNKKLSFQDNSDGKNETGAEEISFQNLIFGDQKDYNIMIRHFRHIKLEILISFKLLLILLFYVFICIYLFIYVYMKHFKTSAISAF